MKIFPRGKYIGFNRVTITLLGNPSRLVFMFDEPNERLIILPSYEATIDSFEIPPRYWTDNRESCRIYRFAFFLMLKERFGWKNDKIYVVQGIYQNVEDTQKLIVFNFEDVIEVEQGDDEI